MDSFSFATIARDNIMSWTQLISTGDEMKAKMLLWLTRDKSFIILKTLCFYNRLEIQNYLLTICGTEH